MNILFVYGAPINPTRGGVQRITYNLAQEFSQRGHIVHFLAFEGGIDSFFVSSFCQYFVPNTDNVSSLENKICLKRIIEKNHISVVVNQVAMAHELHRLLSDIKKLCPFLLISCIHNSVFGGVENYDRSHYNLLKRTHLSFFSFLFKIPVVKKILSSLYIIKNRNFFREMESGSDYVLALTMTMQKEIIKMLGYDSDKIKIIPDCTDTIHGNNIISEKKNVFLYVGKIDNGYKRVDMIPPIWAEFCKRESSTGYELVLIGDGNYRHKLEELFKVRHLNNVKFMGWTPPDDFYKVAKGLLITSCSESFSMVAIEAMSCGVVPLAYDSYPELHEVIENGKSGLVAKEACVNHYVENMIKIVSDDNKRNSLVLGALEKAKTYDVKRVADLWENLFSYEK